MSGDQFKAGDVVELKSGGPPMTVTGVNTNLVGYTEIKCVWWCLGSLENGTFSPSVLMPSRPKTFEELKGGWSPPIPAASHLDNK